MTPLPQTHTYDLRDSISKRPLIGFWKLMTGFRGFYVAAVITLAVSALAQTGASLLVRHFVDEVLPLPNFADFLLGIALGFVLLAIVQGAFSFMSGRLASQTAEGLALRIRNFMFDHIQKLSFTYHDNMKTGELLQRATSDVDAVRRFFSEQAIGVGRISLLFRRGAYQPVVYGQLHGFADFTLAVGSDFGSCRAGDCSDVVLLLQAHLGPV